MKKIALIIASLIAVAAFADDALVLPQGVLRITTALSFGSWDETYDADGEAQDATETSFTNVGAAVEYGVNDWISAAFQWAPGYNITSDIDGSKAKINGPMDIFAGAKIQIVGAKAPVANEQFRFAVAPGIKIPLPGADFTEERENVLAGDEFIAKDVDKHALGLGFRLYGDYIVNKMFFVNLYSEFIYYTEKKDAEALAFTPAPVVAKYDIAFGYDFKLEVEPQFQYMVADGMRMSAALPITYSASPAYETNGNEVADSEISKLNLGPSVGMFFMKSVVPFEVKVAYIYPVMGDNTQKTKTLSLQAKVYLKF